MSNTFLISDTHFSHNGVVKFLCDDGSKLRPWDNVEDMDEAMVDNWNTVVRPQDKVYHLGDVVINRKALKILSRLNGTKVLIKGNHDIFRLEEYTPYFKDVRGSHKLENFILTHIPLHPDSVARWCDGNLHGHLHSNRVMKTVHRQYEFLNYEVLDTRYHSVCVEQINFTPIAYEDLKVKIAKEREQHGQI